MSLETLEAFEVFEAEFAEVEDRQRRQLLWVWWEVPRLESVSSQLYTLYVFHPGDNVVVATVGHQTARHARCSRNTIRAVLGILVVNNAHIRQYILDFSLLFQRQVTHLFTVIVQKLGSEGERAPLFYWTHNGKAESGKKHTNQWAIIGN